MHSRERKCALHPLQPVVIDCRGHMLGRLASVLAKQLLTGQYVVAVRCEEIDISGAANTACRFAVPWRPDMRRLVAFGIARGVRLIGYAISRSLLFTASCNILH